MVSMLTDHANGFFRFGAYEADPGTGELRKSGVRLDVQDQPFQVLLVLLKRPTEVVTREELREKLWPADTFVDFDHSLNTVINKLREALNDSAANPRFIETLSRRGYRFLPPVEFVAKQTGPAFPPASPAIIAAPVAVSHNTVSVLTRLEDVPPVQRKYVRALFFLIQVMYLCFYVISLARLTFVHALFEQTISYPGWAIALLVVS